MHACCLLCSEGQIVESRDCYILVMLPVQFGGAGGLEPFRMEGLSSHLHPCTDHPVIFSVMFRTVPVLGDDIGQYRVSPQQHGEF